MIGRLGIGILMMAWLTAPVWAADAAGDWRVTISTGDATITGKASLQQAGNTVTGWVGPSENDPIPVKGTVNGNKLTLKTFPQPGRTVAFEKCDLTISAEKLTGTIDTDKGKIEFVRSAP